MAHANAAPHAVVYVYSIPAPMTFPSIARGHDHFENSGRKKVVPPTSVFGWQRNKKFAILAHSLSAGSFVQSCLASFLPSFLPSSFRAITRGNCGVGGKRGCCLWRKRNRQREDGKGVLNRPQRAHECGFPPLPSPPSLPLPPPPVANVQRYFNLKGTRSKKSKWGSALV